MHCCYFYSKILYESKYDEEKKCLSLTNSEYKNIPEMIKNTKKMYKELGGQIAKFSLDCHAESGLKINYIFASIISLALFLL